MPAPPVQIPRENCSWAYKVQESQGTAMTQGTQIALPLPAGASGQEDRHFKFPKYADGTAFESQYIGGGTWPEGTIRVPLIPGYVNALLGWVMTRDGDNQGQWATVWQDLVRVTRKFYDCKVVTAKITLSSFGTPELEINWRGKGVSTDEAITGALPAAYREYTFDEAAISIDYDGSTTAADYSLRNIAFDIDNQIETGEEGGRIRASEYPYTLDNKSGMVVTGTLDRDFADSSLYDAWKAKNVGKIIATLTRGANVATFTASRVFWADPKYDIPGGENELLKEPCTFRCLGSTDGATAPLTAAEV